MAPAADKRLSGRKVAAVACFDSFGKVAMTLLAACRKEGAETTLHLLQVSNRALSRRQRLEIHRTDRRTAVKKGAWGDFRSLTAAMAGDVDVLILGLDGLRSRDALLMLAKEWSGRTDRPVLVSAYPGILFRFALEGMLDRSGADLLCLNSEQDLSTYQLGRHALGLSSDNAVVTGLPLLWNADPHRAAPDQPSIVFFEQPSIPAHPLQRRYICKQLKALAEAWPDHPVIFKPRTSSIESTLHRRHGEMAGVIERMSETVPNLQLSFKPATRLLRQCGCAITVSSTAALEAMALGISTRIVGDLGVTETLGNHFFADSGAVADFASITRDPFTPSHRVEWLQRSGLQPQGRETFLTALLERLHQERSPLPTEGLGPGSWGSRQWQTYALRHGGRRMLSSAGARSSQRKRHKTRTALRRLRDGLVGFGWLSRWLRER
ncbi:DUF6716 putative glycosyltransferase [Synechococcus sp. A15-28]|jgi:hypothetical protein|uniref:DUF6716 putative glycosyltransferase n=1 Tax=Synechococcus sp. A15-28 TaxID=1050638 RepID=UPI0016450ABB|nr:DUF6716 putative glycosyltransferase [Synechococcus sp. A15-28]QNI41512.1 putative UDP-glycosyltransferase/glycogen phosphorylase family protein [Synechococcus sp. A15-28]